MLNDSARSCSVRAELATVRGSGRQLRQPPRPRRRRYVTVRRRERRCAARGGAPSGESAVAGQRRVRRRQRRWRRSSPPRLPLAQDSREASLLRSRFRARRAPRPSATGRRSLRVARPPRFMNAAEPWRRGSPSRRGCRGQSSGVCHTRRGRGAAAELLVAASALRRPPSPEERNSRIALRSPSSGVDAAAASS